MSTGKKKLLIVDDIEINRVLLKELFRKDFELLEAEDGEAALELIRDNREELAVVLLDLVMPVMDGFEVLEAMNANCWIQRIPVILITSENDDEKAMLSYGLGVSDLVHKPFNPDIVYRRVHNIADLYSYKNHLEQKLAEQKNALEKQAIRLRDSHLFLVDALSNAVGFRNLESGEHIKRIRALVRILMERMARHYPSITPERVELIASASALHDIGKIAIPDKVLLKPGPLTPKEFEVMKGHSIRGCEILDSLHHTHNKEYFKYCYDICRHHHERWDGRGYPDGLRGDEISIWAQVTSLADVYDALTSKRVYKAAYAHDEASRMILEGECGAFNPKLMDCFLEIKDTLTQRLKIAHAKERGLTAPCPHGAS